MNDFYNIAKNLLVDLLSAYSPSGREDKARKVIMEFAGKWGLRTVVDKSGNILISKDEDIGYKGLSLVSHMDTVIGELPVKVTGDEVYGRGAVDAKGPLTSMILSLIYPRLRCKDLFYAVYALVDEEGESKGAKELVDSGINLSHTIIGEPTGHRICLGYRGRILLNVVCDAKGGHASSPEVGDSALDKLFELYRYIKYILNTTGATTVLTKVVSGETDNSLPTRAFGVIDVRVVNLEKTVKALNHLNNIATRIECVITIKNRIEPIYTSPNSTVTKALQRSLLKNGYKISMVRKRGTSDMNILYRISESIVAYGPGDPLYAHTRHEKIGIKDIVFSSKIYAGVYKELCSIIH